MLRRNDGSGNHRAPSAGGLQHKTLLNPASLVVHPQCFVGMTGLVITVHFSRSAVERISSPAATSRSEVLSPPQSSRVFSRIFWPLMSPRQFGGKTSALLSPLGFAERTTPGVAKAACDQNGGDAKKQDGDVCKEGCDVEVATPPGPFRRQAGATGRAGPAKTSYPVLVGSARR